MQASSRAPCSSRRSGVGMSCLCFFEISTRAHALDNIIRDPVHPYCGDTATCMAMLLSRIGSRPGADSGAPSHGSQVLGGNACSHPWAQKFAIIRCAFVRCAFKEFLGLPKSAAGLSDSPLLWQLPYLLLPMCSAYSSAIYKCQHTVAALECVSSLCMALDLLLGFTFK